MSNIHDVQAYYNASDAIKCPSCFDKNISVLGVITVAGLNHNNYLCGGCNKTFTALPAHVKSLADAAQISHNGISFSSASLTTQNNGQWNTTTTAANPTGISNNWLTNGQTISTNITSPINFNHNSQLANVESNTNRTANEMQNLKYEIQNLLIELRNIVQENKRLNEQLVKDPLSGVRKSILDFNLK